jgi:hypothetical protein
MTADEQRLSTEVCSFFMSSESAWTYDGDEDDHLMIVPTAPRHSPATMLALCGGW